MRARSVAEAGEVGRWACVCCRNSLGMGLVVEWRIGREGSAAV